MSRALRPSEPESQTGSGITQMSGRLPSVAASPGRLTRLRKMVEIMSKRTRQTKSLADRIGFVAACLLALAMAIGFNWIILGDWNASFPSSHPTRIRRHTRHIEPDNSDEERISKPLDANMQVNRAPGNFF